MVLQKQNDSNIQIRPTSGQLLAHFGHKYGKNDQFPDMVPSHLNHFRAMEFWELDNEIWQACSS